MFNHTINSLPSYQSPESAMSIISMAFSLMFGAGELIVTFGFITAFSFMVCYGFGAIMEPKEARFDDVDTETPSKSNTASIFMSAMLSGFHVTFVFFGLPLFGHAADPFFLRLIVSCAIIAALTTGVALGSIVICLVAPVARSCRMSITRFIRRTPAEADIEAQVERQAFILPAEKEPLQ